MAGPVLRHTSKRLLNPVFSRDSAVLQLFEAEREESVYRILLEEIVSLGLLRAVVVDLDAESGKIEPVASLNCDARLLDKFRTNRKEPESAFLSVLKDLEPALVSVKTFPGGTFYVYPAIYRTDVSCREAGHGQSEKCLGIENTRAKHQSVAQQRCTACGMCGYVRLVVGQVSRNASPTQLQQFRDLAKHANRQLSRLWKMQFYANEMRGHDNLEKLRATEGIVRQERDRLNMVIENVGDPIVVGDGAAKVVLLDPLARSLFGLTAGEGDARLVANEAKVNAYLSAFTFSLLDHQNKALHLYDPESESNAEYATRSGKVYDDRGRVAYTVTVLRDLSAWKQLEQLQTERRMLEMEKFAATGRLAGTIAHEINNPLEAIKNAIYLLKDRIDMDAQPIYDALKSETDRVTRIVRQMLGLYRSNTQLGKFDLNSIVEDTLALLSGSLKKSGVVVKKRYGELPPLNGSADQFRQLLSNLVVNAQDSMQAGGQLTLRTRYTKAMRGQHGEISLVVADTGSGIAKEVRERMFEPFVSTKGEKGTGLGLWIVQGIIERHSGRIQVRSSLERGTVVKIIFPVSGS